MKNLKDLTYGIVGLGIMGGSIAKAIRERILCRSGAEGKIYVCNRSTACLTQALAEGIADKAFTSAEYEKMLPECDFVYVCLYPQATIDFLEKNREFFKSGAIVTDISGVKGIFEKSLPSILRPDVDFIIGHPMAGGEKEGYANSTAKMFIDHNYILCPIESNRPENLELMRNFISEIGFTRITETTCDIHDYKIGFTSQLCHVIACSLVDSAKDDQITAFGGGSFEDLTRIAMINAPLWTELFVSNREKLVEHIENFERQIEKFKNAIKTKDTAELMSLMEESREKRIKMGFIRTVAKK
ncbi:MAG: prephenate dehydrogenase [Spirochaetia bacterium]|nr:prephenate dehydrogenase [Spirochaetia bacterium]